MRQDNEIDFGTYKVRCGRKKQSKFIPLYSNEQIEKAIIELRTMLQTDESPETKKVLQGKIAQQIERFNGHWFQRIDYPDHQITSTSNHSLVHFDEGGVNTLGGKLTSEEASILRPYPKWFYLKPLLPDLKGKSVLELGSSNGFFSFQFSKLGAKQVTGIEILKTQYESAVWSKNILDCKNVSFLNTDFLMDFTIPKSDIVFLSEVHNHLLFPFYGLLRILSLSNEMVIFDTGASVSEKQEIELSTAWRVPDRQFICHSFQLSDGVISDFLNLIGINSSRITRYREEGSNHILYVINTQNWQFPIAESLQQSLNLHIIIDAEKQSSDSLKLKAELQEVKKQLQSELKLSRSRIQAMESSKFWKMRLAWFKIKKMFGFTEAP
jgi:SAM-dependent methyltransferase